VNSLPRAEHQQGGFSRIARAMDERDERKELRERQEVLHRRTVELQRETEQLRGSKDLGAIRTHQQKLKHYEEDLKIFDQNRGEFHDRFGPLGHKEKQGDQD
jgi:hypothetical protein